MLRLKCSYGPEKCRVCYNIFERNGSYFEGAGGLAYKRHHHSTRTLPRHLHRKPLETEGSVLGLLVRCWIAGIARCVNINPLLLCYIHETFCGLEGFLLQMCEYRLMHTRGGATCGAKRLNRTEGLLETLGGPRCLPDSSLCRRLMNATNFLTLKATKTHLKKKEPNALNSVRCA